MKLALKVIVITAILQVSSMAFADEMILSMLILLTIALTAAALVTWRSEEHMPSEIPETSITAAEGDVVAAASRE